MKASILKSTPSKNGGFVNTLAVEGTVQDSILGEVTVKDRYYFKSPDALVEEGADPKELDGFSITNYDVNKIRSVDEESGEERINKWITPKTW